MIYGNLNKDAEKRAAYDQVRQRWQGGARAEPPPDWDTGFEFGGLGDAAMGHSDFFEALFGKRPPPGHATRHGFDVRGQDHHAKVHVDIVDAYHGAERTLSLQTPALDEQGRVVLRQHRISVRIPRGVRSGQQLRLAGQGGPGIGEGAPGDLYLEVAFHPHPLWRVQDLDVLLDLPVAPWEAALGTHVMLPVPDGTIELRVPPNATPGMRLRVKGKGLPGNPPGDLYAVLTLVVPPATTAEAQRAYRTFGTAFADFDPRPAMNT